MQTRYIKRNLEQKTYRYLKIFPATAILGPRQSGKSTLALNILKKIKNSIYIDLEKDSNQIRLKDPEFFLRNNMNKLVCLDEIQKLPGIFKALRSFIDENRMNGQFLILGSASRDLIKQSSESLAGRIGYLELPPFCLNELLRNKKYNEKIINKFWLRGGFPRSYLAFNLNDSIEWRLNFIRTFLERDIPQIGFQIPANSIKRLWQMCANSHGQILNSSRLGESLGISHTTVKSYIDILVQTFMLRILPPYSINIRKRLVKSPKIYIRDTGILHSLLNINEFNELMGHQVFGSSWEGFMLENILAGINNADYGFYRTSSGTEIDLIIARGNKRIGIEFKASTSPKLSKGFYMLAKELKLDHIFVVSPVQETYQIEKKIYITSPLDIIQRINKIFNSN